MLFSSVSFLYVFLPAVLLCYALARGRWKNHVLLLFSLLFYAAGEPVYIVLLLFTAAVDYALALVVERYAGKRRARAALVLALVSNLLMLAFFKYADFLIGAVNGLLGTRIPLLRIPLPVGISFFTFQTMSYVIDVYRREVPAERNVLTLTTYVSLFPQLIAGPIVSQGEMLPQFAEIGKKKLDAETFSAGIYLFTLGMVKKVLVADTFGLAVDWGYSNIPALSSTDSLLLVFFYSIQLYFDFSGYCDMARGLAWLFGMEIPVNFDSPYKAVNIVEFWRRWHITLSRFFRQYVYIPLGGNRRGRPRMYANLILIFLLSGIWHGAGWTFVVWGATQGVLYIITRAVQLYGKAHPGPGPAPFARRIRRAAGTLFTFCFFSFACVFFRSETMAQAYAVFRRLFTAGFTLPAQALTEGFNLDELWYVIKLFHIDALPYSTLYLPAAITAGALITIFFAPNADQCAERFRPRTANALLTAFLFLWCVLSLSGVSSFLYFNF